MQSWPIDLCSHNLSWPHSIMTNITKLLGQVLIHFNPNFITSGLSMPIFTLHPHTHVPTLLYLISSHKRNILTSQPKHVHYHINSTGPYHNTPTWPTQPLQHTTYLVHPAYMIPSSYLPHISAPPLLPTSLTFVHFPVWVYRIPPNHVCSNTSHHTATFIEHSSHNNTTPRAFNIDHNHSNQCKNHHHRNTKCRWN
jgi:hypothetical protein